MRFTNAFTVLAAYALLAVANVEPTQGKLDGEIVNSAAQVISDPLSLPIDALSRLEATKDEVRNAVHAKGMKVARQEPPTIAYALTAR